MRKLTTALIMFAACLFLLVSCDNSGEALPGSEATPQPTAFASPQTEATAAPQTQAPKTAKIGDDTPISRAVAAKMLAFAFFDKMSIDTLEREITFSDTSAGMWYDRYINAVYLNGLMSGAGDTFMPDNWLTLTQAQYLLDIMDENNTVKMVIADENKDMPISYALWVDLYTQVLNNISGNKVSEYFGITTERLIPLATSGSNGQLPAYTMVTASGTATYAGLNMDEYIDKAITVLRKDGEIIALLSIADETPVIKNAYIASVKPDSITVFSGGAERTYSFDTANLPDGTICDIKVFEGTALEVNVFSESVTGVVKRVTSSYVELLEHGIINTGDGMKIYGISNGAPTWRALSNITIGTDIAEFILEGGIIRAAVIKKTAEPERLRVCISTSGYGGYIHDSVVLTCNTAFTVRAGDTVIKYNTKDIFTVSATENADLFGETRIYITPDEPDGKIQIRSITRNWPDNERPWYRGMIEIALEPDGRFTIVNEVSFEEYLYAVVPSEMPTSHGLEASKVQAVTARSYAYNQYFTNRYHQYGANVDDSVLSQVYNNIPENATSIKACDETAGLCLVYNDKVISANFFSTSSGMTANSGEVWANGSTRQFPTATESYLKSVKQYTGADYGDLRLEANAERFFKETEIESYDRAFGWFRWNVEMTAQEIAASINSAIAARYNANPMLIKTMQSNGVYRSRPIETIGELLDMEVVSRGEAGNITSLKITGSEAVVIVYTEYNIRMLLKPMKILAGGRNIVLNRISGGGVTNYSLMPSAFFVFDKTFGDGGLERIHFYGGGNGHGAGMSQNGVKGMIDAGFEFEEILKHYYNGTQVVKKW